MRKAKVKILALSGKNGRSIFRAPQIITENDVIGFDELIKSGKIEEIKEVKKEVKQKATKAE